jgi:multiple sugar transport system substrate-binding protein
MVVRSMLNAGLALGALLYANGVSAADISLRYAIWDQSQAPAFERIIEAFEAANPDIAVELQVTPTGGNQYWTKLQTEAGNNNLPDVFWMNPFNFPLYASQGVVMPIDDMVASSGFDVNAIPEEMRAIYTYDGHLYALPNNRDAIVVWYNKALFEAAGVPEPQPGWTWDDFRTTAKALTNPGSNVWGTAIYLDFRQLFVNVIHQAGGDILSNDIQTAQWDTPEVRAGLQYLVDIMSDGSSPTLQQITDTGQNALFLSGNIAMLYAGSWLGVSFADSDLARNGDLGVAELPAGPVDNASSTSSLGNMIAAGGANTEAAYRFVEFLGSKEAADIYTQSGIALSAYPEFDSNFVNYFEGKFDAQPISDQIANVFAVPVSINSSVWMRAINDNLGPVFSGQRSLEEAVLALQAAMQTALDSE